MTWEKGLDSESSSAGEFQMDSFFSETRWVPRMEMDQTRNQAIYRCYLEKVFWKKSLGSAFFLGEPNVPVYSSVPHASSFCATFFPLKTGRQEQPRAKIPLHDFPRSSRQNPTSCREYRFDLKNVPLSLQTPKNEPFPPPQEGRRAYGKGVGGIAKQFSLMKYTHTSGLPPSRDR